jgi:hypothetical protein
MKIPRTFMIWEPDLNSQLKEGVRGSTVGSRRKMQALLLISETALTVLLLVCAGLLLRSFVKALNADTGFKTENVLVFDLSVPDFKAPATADKVRLGQQLMERLAQIPGVATVGMASSVPMNGGNWLGDMVSREDRPEPTTNPELRSIQWAETFFKPWRFPCCKAVCSLRRTIPKRRRR